MRELVVVLVLVIALCFGLACQQRHQSTPPPQDTHTPKDSIFDDRTYYEKRGYCADVDRPNLACDGVRPR